MTWTRAWLVALVCVLLPPGLAPANCSDLLDPPQGLFLDEWAEVQMAGGRVGYMHSTITRDGNVIQTSTTTKLKLGRVDQPVEIKMLQTTTETLDGIPIAFDSQMSASLMKTTRSGRIKDGRMTVVSSQYGMEQKQAFDYPKGALMSWGLFREGLLRGFAPGTAYTLNAYVPDVRLDGAVKTVTKIGDWEEFDHAGRNLRGQRTTVILESPIGSIESVSWNDKDGRPIKAVIPMPGLGDMVMITTDQETALADFVPPEVFMRTVVKATRKIDPKSTRWIKYRIRGNRPDVDLSKLPSAGMQTVGARTDQSVEILIARQHHKAPTPQSKEGADSPAPGTLTAGELAEFLEPNLMINTNDPKLAELAKRAAAGETAPYKLADNLRRFVTDYIEAKTLNIGFATASEVGRTKEGDCSEHGVLLAALGRLNGLPSRVVVGLAYVPVFGKQDDIFGYHMWTQFYIDGRWIDVDAALRETVCSPTRIAFATSSLKNTGLADLSLPLLSKIGAIDIDILELEKATDPEDR